MVSYGQIHLKTDSFYRKLFHWQKVSFEASKSQALLIVEIAERSLKLWDFKKQKKDVIENI